MTMELVWLLPSQSKGWLEDIALEVRGRESRWCAFFLMREKMKGFLSEGRKRTGKGRAEKEDSDHDKMKMFE